MKLTSSSVLAVGMLSGLAVATTLKNYSYGEPFVLRSRVWQFNVAASENPADFNDKYVKYNPATATLDLVEQSQLSVFHIANGTDTISNDTISGANGHHDPLVTEATVVVSGTSPPISISLYPDGTTTEMYDNGTVIAHDPKTGAVLTPNGPGEFWKLLLDAGPGTPGADPTTRYGLLFDGARFCAWGACKIPATDDSQVERISVSWQRCPSRIQGPSGCATMTLLVEDPPQQAHLTSD